jgi:hypothetical protein
MEQVHREIIKYVKKKYEVNNLNGGRLIRKLIIEGYFKTALYVFKKSKYINVGGTRFLYFAQMQ